MAVRSELLELLACPKCKGSVSFNTENDTIVCSSCKLRFPVRDDIPVMLIDEAEAY